MTILDGKKISEKILKNLKKRVKKKLTLAVVFVGKNPISEIFIRRKKIICEKMGIGFRLYSFPSTISKNLLKKELIKIIKNPSNSGVIIQLPLPKKFNPEEFLNLIPEEKDVDVLSERNLGKFYQGSLKILPPTVAGILELLKQYKIELRGKNVVILGAGRLVGFPLALQLLKEKATVSVLNEFTKDTFFYTKKADILISAVGKANLVKGEMIKKGAVVIDAGASLWRGKLRGDVDFQSVSKKASFLTPSPGGVGPMTVAFLIKNLIQLSQ
jgi:methylenetetrahydrofolate dehydrogenase (NADP+)/methenyltetrahydrofolate cyclohydrolase